MSSTPTIKAVTNGTSTTDTNPAQDSAPQRSSGLAHVWELQVYYTVSLGDSALLEAQQLLHKIQRIASCSQRPEEAQPLDMADVGSSLREALDCMDIAMEHLSALSVSIRSRLDEEYTGGPMF